MRSHESLWSRIIFFLMFLVIGLGLFEGNFHLKGWDLVMVPFNLLFSFTSLGLAYLVLVEGFEPSFPKPAPSNQASLDPAPPKTQPLPAPPVAAPPPAVAKAAPLPTSLPVPKPEAKAPAPKTLLTEKQMELLLNDRRTKPSDPLRELQGLKHSIARYPLENGGKRRVRFRMKPVLDEDQWEKGMAAKLKGLRCPGCGSCDLGVMLWGQLPVGDGRANHLMRLKLLVPGGCFMGEEDVTCNDCHAYWVSGRNLSEFGRGGFRMTGGGGAA